MDGVQKEIKLDHTEWHYKNEGACNVILSYNGPFDSSLTSHVLRLKKTSSKSTHSHHEREMAEYTFVKEVLLPKIGADYVHPGVIVKVNTPFLEKVNEVIQPLRPPHRLVAHLDLAATSAFVLPDLSIFPKHASSTKHTFCIEIKPKWGFVTSSPFVHPRHQIKKQACRYCLHQHLKILQGSIHHISEYCPQDLYSGDPVRIRKALRALLAHPQNNLKVYCDGELCFTGSLGGRKKTDTDFDLDHLANKLKDAFPHSKDTLSSLVDILLQILTREPVLQNLKKIQVQDNIDIEAIYYLYKKHVLQTTDFSDIPDSARFEALETLDSGEISRKISEFMIAATAKDCSVMIALLPLDPEQKQLSNGHFKSLNVPEEGEIQYRIGVVDLDERLPGLIPQYYKLDQEIVREFLAASATGPQATIRCV
eukprot:Phypoly_transcript_06445.p1 GENE.Phypoly_transcript_06445~~Phypoly_transcript_06445.p1  ORF type:complete len:423 (+),score=75.46 Phypoly_transcript_06445:494-1762(+)